ncbi:hypothetical protein BOTBODRAFT_28000 [Botryobasidium botryosum FD-172 SS1]|uniref:Uncharacterized protein n=1 Tax=Botryobasidium botryosum (strain FD-172 SS1) TaxID=930990 RepID=A0A067N6M4_BOTB1|nr:hypothetical protein BOTBODRAFT_28000 [Botryobasidium botryosum FD-172 SS1]
MAATSIYLDIPHRPHHHHARPIATPPSLSPSRSSSTASFSTRKVEALAYSLSERSSEKQSTIVEAERRLTDAISEARSLVDALQGFHRAISKHGEAIRRMRDVQVPSVAANITEAREMCEDVAERLPDLKENIENADREYVRGRQKAARLEIQLQWLAAQWHVKLWKIISGQVRGKRRTLFLRVLLPLVIILCGIGVLALLLWQLWLYLWRR